MRRRDKGNTSEGGVTIEKESDSEPPYNERDIDREIELRAAKEQLTSTNSLKDISTSSLTSSQTESTTPDRDGLFTAKRVLIQRKDSETSATTTTSSEDSAPVAPRLQRYPAYPAPDLGKSFSTENSKPIRRFSEDILSTSSERRGEDEGDYRPYRGAGGARSMTYATQQHLRRIAMETQALRQKEEERRIEQERRALDRQRIEQELAKTRSELEREESIDDLIARQNPDIMARVPDGSSKYSDYGSRADSTSIASDYSTTSSTTFGADLSNKPYSLHAQLGHSSDYSSSTSPTSVHGDGSRLGRPLPYGASRGRYEGDDGSKDVADGSSTAGSTKGVHHSVSRDDMDLYRSAPRPVFDVSKIATKGTLVRKRSKSPTRKQQDNAGTAEYGSSLKRSGSLQRKGSLDSLRDFYDKPDSNPYLSGSENEDDMVESLTSTFDEKLKKLLEPKPQSRFDPPTSKRTPPVGSESTAPPPPQQQQQQQQQQHTSPPPRPISHSTPTNQPTKETFEHFEPSYQNPSLHRVREGGSRDNLTEPDRQSGSRSSPARSSPARGSERWGGGGAPTSLGLHRDLGSDPAPNARPYGALAPEGANTGMRRWERESSDDYAAQLRKSSEKLYGSRERLLEVTPTPPDNNVPSPDRAPTTKGPPVLRPRGIKGRSVSPPARTRDSNSVTTIQGRRPRRRHTVAGSSDYDHMAALAAVGHGEPGGKRPRSAWERLQPAASPTEGTEGAAKNLRDWCERERLRTVGSSPALLSFTIQPAPPQQQQHQPSQEQPPELPARRTDFYTRSMSQPPPGSSNPPTPPITAGGRASFTFESSI